MTRGPSAYGLFAGPAPRVRAALASTSFLDALVSALIAELYGPDDPFALSDALILVPNRRAAMGFMDAFAEKLGGAALLPTIRPLGDVEDDPDVWGAEPMGLDLAPAIDPLQRRLELASLIRARDAAQGGASDPVRAIAFADALCRLLDSAAAGDGAEWSKLDDLSLERELAEHWARSAQFLQIVTQRWPERLREDGLLDPGERRSLLLAGLATEWERAPPQTPVVIAGSTGSIAATRALMRVVARLPRGVVVLPGLDVDLDDAAWEQVSEQHPQFALKQTLKALGVARASVPLIGAAASPDAEARRVLIREALAPADSTADWPRRLEAAGGRALAIRGAEGLTLIEAATEDEEAAIIALLMRERLEHPNADVALVTPNANLARRVEAKLARWGVQPMLSQSRLLETAPVGVLLSLLTTLALDEAEPVALLGLLKHPLTGLMIADEARAEATTALEHARLRGPRRFVGLADLRRKASYGVVALVDAVIEALAPLRAAFGPGEMRLADAAAAIADAAERVGATREADGARRVWAGGDGAAAARFLRKLIENGGQLGALSPLDAARAFRRLMSEEQVPPARAGDPRVQILGPLEARLGQPDLVILGSLNEGDWPAPAPEDPFLSRAMRTAVGLPSPDVRLGLAAHDFAQLANAPRVVMTRALKSGGAPTVASRWLWRLKTFLRAADSEALIDPHTEYDPRTWARTADMPRVNERAAEPRPRLPKGVKLEQLSVTDVETLVRDPYAIYGKRVLGLRALDPVGAEPGANFKGSAIHRAIERLGESDDPALLARYIEEELEAAGFAPERRAAERARGARACRAFTEWLQERRAAGAQAFIEKKGRIELSEGFALTCRADRIDVMRGSALVVDYKTGSPPTNEQVKSGLAPQLLLEAAMLERGGFADIARVRAEGLLYWHFNRARPRPVAIELETSVSQAAQDALAKLEGLLAAYRRGRPFVSKPHVQFVYRYGEYDLLARRHEWVDAGDSE